MRPPIRSLVKLCVETLPLAEPFIEFGSRQVPQQEQLANLRPFFAQKCYVGVDMLRGEGVDVVFDITHTGLASESAGTILMLETLEHVEFPRRAIDEVYRILKPEGTLIASSVMNFPLHNPPDYWRFSPQSFASLLQPFETAFVSFSGLRYFPHTVIGIGFKGPLPVAMHNQFLPALQQWQGIWQHDMRALMRLLAPPILLEGYTRFRDRNAPVETLPPLTILRS